MKYNLQTIVRQCNGGKPMSFVFFWRGLKSYGRIDSSCLSQWYPCAFTEDGVTYSTAEQYMMAQKAQLFHDEDTYSRIMSATHPSDCKKLGRMVRNFSPELWDRSKYGIVLKGSLLKFSQNPDCLDFLLKTGDAVLAEASPYDQIWGVGLPQEDERIRNPKLWRGENLLGFALMEARDILAQER
ncbi:MAG: NADAR family protein [Victivallales bacterium]|nr:NADAR family protein [Victivallales bacterium]